MRGVFSGVNFQSNDFELFNLEQKFKQSSAAIELRWKELQREAHPDKFVMQGTAAQRVAMQWSVRINEAYRRLKDPQSRAAYLCELNGVPVNAENSTVMPAEFLMLQIEWREALNDATTLENLYELAMQANKYVCNLLLKIEQSIDFETDFERAVEHIRALMFVERFSAEVDTRIDQLQQ